MHGETYRMICLIIYVLAFSDCVFLSHCESKFSMSFRHPKKVAYGIIPIPPFPRVVCMERLGFLISALDPVPRNGGINLLGRHQGAHKTQGRRFFDFSEDILDGIELKRVHHEGHPLRWRHRKIKNATWPSHGEEWIPPLAWRKSGRCLSFERKDNLEMSGPLSEHGLSIESVGTALEREL
jgi:hypothetical protein